MTAPAQSHYTGARIAFGTMHGKEQTVAPAFRARLGATVIAAPGIDTDRFGTFSGTVPRLLTPLQTAAAKADLAMETTGLDYGLASEASYTADFGLFVQHHEILLFQDRSLDLTVTEVNVVQRAADRRLSKSVTETLTAAESLGFPASMITLSATTETGPVHHSGLTTHHAVTTAAGELLARTDTITVTQDHRAFADPSRRAIIANLADRLAHRLTQHCPNCNAPGWGPIDVERGLPCADCGEPTAGIRADVLGCGRCTSRTTHHRAAKTIDPQWCDTCNP